MLTLVVALAWAAPAWAGGWVVDAPRAEKGPGIKVGKRSRFHPGFGISGGYDSNAFRTRAAEGIRGGGFLTPTGWFELGNTPYLNGRLDSSPKPGESKLDYNIRVGADYRAYLTSDPRLRGAGRFNTQIGANFMILPGRKVSVFIDEDFRRVGEPQNFEASPDFNFNRFDARTNLGLIFRPGGGRLALSLAYRNQFLYFQSPELTTGDRTVNGIFHETKWRFRDRMALVARYSFDYYYHFCCVDPGEGRNEDSSQHRVLGGFAGQLGKRWTFQALGGYGWGLYKDDVNGPDHKNFLADVATSWFPRETTELRLSFGRRFDDSLWGNYFTDLGGGVELSHVFRWRMSTYGGLRISQRRTAGLPVPGVETQTIAEYFNAPGFVREDLIVAGQFRVEQALGRFFAIGLRYDLAVDQTDFQANFVDGNFDLGGFTRHMIQLMAAVRY